MTRQTTLNDPDLPRLAAELRASYGPRLERVVLFGSRARGDSKLDSDYDVAVFLHDYRSLRTQLTKAARHHYHRHPDGHRGRDFGEPFPAGSYKERSAFIGEVRRDGIDL
jgi:predicted nucleotidyltransferase